MKNITSHLKNALMLFLIISNYSCASYALTPPPQLELRTLIPNEDFTEYTYHYEVCAKKFLGLCVNKEWTTDVYPVSDKDKMKQLKAMNFVLRVRELP